MLQFNEANLLLTIAKWFFTSLNSGFSQMNVNKSNVDIININYFEWYSGGRGVLFYRPLNPLFWPASPFTTTPSLSSAIISFINELFLFPITVSNPVYREGNRASSTRTFLRRTFIKHEFHHLNVPLVGTVAVSDVFDCTLECLSNPFCFSVNMAAFKGAHGKLWCELLSSDKFRNSTEYKGNKSSHHFAIEVGNTLNFDK